MNNTLTRAVADSGTVTVDASAWYSIEQDYDYLYAEYSTDGGKTWTKLGDPISGPSGDWTKLHYSYSASGPSLFRFRYQTDGGVNLEGAFLDDIAVSAGGTTVTDGAEGDGSGWTAKGWKITTGTETVTTPQYYLLENRAYVGYDDTLRTGPYNFSEAVTRPNWVEYFPTRTGCWPGTSTTRTPTTTPRRTPGHGYALPVDARPKPFRYKDGTMPGNRRQPFDATFGRQRTDKVCLHKQGSLGRSGTYRPATACAPSSAGIPTFDDTDPNAYYSRQNPMNSTKVGGFGVRATVTKQDGQSMTVKVVNPANR